LKRPLWVATTLGYTEVVKRLIEANASLSESSLNYHPELSHAVDNGFTEIGRLLIQAGADVNRGDYLHTTCRQGFVDFTQLLLNARANINFRGTIDLQTPLVYVLSDSRRRWNLPNSVLVDLVKMLVEAKTDVNLADRERNTALLLALSGSRRYWESPDLPEQVVLEIVKILIGAKADVNLCDCPTNRLGITALMRAASRGSTKLVEILLKAGANPSAFGNVFTRENVFFRYASPLDEALFGRHDAVIEMLVFAGADTKHTHMKPKVKAAIDKKKSAMVAQFQVFHQYVQNLPNENCLLVGLVYETLYGAKP
jgi:ankyrin repeat protein